MTNKNKENSLMREMKNTMKLGVGSMAGMGAMGAMASVPGMPAAAVGVQRTANLGLGLLNVGQLAKTGLAVGETVTGKQQKRKSGNKYIDRIL